MGTVIPVAVTAEGPTPARPTSRPKHLRLARNQALAYASRLGRSRAGLTQAELAAAIGVRQQVVSDAESVLKDTHGFKAEHIAIGPAEWREQMVRTLADLSGLDAAPIAKVNHESNRDRLQAVVEQLSRLTSALASDQRDPRNVDAVLEAARAVTDLGREAAAYARKAKEA